MPGGPRPPAGPCGPEVLPLGQRGDVEGGLAQAVAADDVDVAQDGLVPDPIGGRQAEELGEGDVFGPLVAHEKDQGFGLDEGVLSLQDGEEEGLVEFPGGSAWPGGLDLDGRVAGLEDLLQGLEGDGRVDELEGVGDPAQELAVRGLLLEPAWKSPVSPGKKRKQARSSGVETMRSLNTVAA